MREEREGDLIPSEVQMITMVSTGGKTMVISTREETVVHMGAGVTGNILKKGTVDHTETLVETEVVIEGIDMNDQDMKEIAGNNIMTEVVNTIEIGLQITSTKVKRLAKVRLVTIVAISPKLGHMVPQ